MRDATRELIPFGEKKALNLTLVVEKPGRDYASREKLQDQDLDVRVLSYLK